MSACTDTTHELAAVITYDSRWIEVWQGVRNVRLTRFDVRALTSRVESSTAATITYGNSGVTFDESQVAAVRAMGIRDLGWVL